jgi:hypothetical protein
MERQNKGFAAKLAVNSRRLARIADAQADHELSYRTINDQRSFSGHVVM